MAVSQNGWPVNPARSRRRIFSDRSTVAITVAEGAGGDLILWALGQIDLRVEDVDLDSTRGELDDWGHADRPIRGGTSTSDHASATAADFNATRHPLGVAISRTFGPGQVAEIRRICAETEGLVVWGGEWSRPDGMHLGLKKGSTPAQCQRVLDRLQNRPAPRPVGSSGVLRHGSVGSEVVRLQKWLNRVYPLYSELAVDGDFGDRTEAVVREFQRRSGLLVDGIVGPVTRRALGL